MTTTFTLGNFALGVIIDGDGAGSVTSDPVGIDCQDDGGSCNAAFTATQTVTLTAVADSGSTFTGWSGICSGVGDCVLRMTESVAVTAVFDLDAYLIYLPMVVKS